MYMDAGLQKKYQFIEFLLLFKGALTRNELVIRFSIGEATASRLIASYIKRYPDQMLFMGARNGYTISKSFKPYYEHSVEDALQYIAYGKISSQLPVQKYGNEYLQSLTNLNIMLVSEITRAIVSNEWLKIEYLSTSSGKTIKNIRVHSLFKAGGSWYFRAFEASDIDIDNINFINSSLNHELIKKCYKTFKFSRVLDAVLNVDSNAIPLAEHEINRDRDDDWNRYRHVQLIPHPKALHPESQMLDLGITDLGVREIVVAEALLGFVLIDLRVDCSKNAELNPYEYPLHLNNLRELSNISSMKIAPGFSQ